MGVFKYGTFVHFLALNIEYSQVQDLETMLLDVILFNLIETTCTTKILHHIFPNVKGIVSPVRALQGNQIQCCILQISAGVPLKQTPKL